VLFNAVSFYCILGQLPLRKWKSFKPKADEPACQFPVNPLLKHRHGQSNLWEDRLARQSVGLGCWQFGGPIMLDGKPDGWTGVNDAESIARYTAPLNSA